MYHGNYVRLSNDGLSNRYTVAVLVDHLRNNLTTISNHLVDHLTIYTLYKCDIYFQE